MTYGQPEPQNPFGPPRQGPGLGQPGHPAPYGPPAQQPGPVPYGKPPQPPQQQPPFGAPQASPYGPPANPAPFGPPPMPPQPQQRPPAPYGPPPGQGFFPGPQPGAPFGPQHQTPPPLPPQGSAAPSNVPGGWSPVQQGPGVPPTPVPDPTPRKAPFAATAIPVVTSDALPGREVSQVIGIVVGVTTRSRDVKVGPDTVALLTQARQDAVAALVTMATDAGADAVVGLRFDGGKIAEALSEVTAYGTAVTLVGADAPAARALPDEPVAALPAGDAVVSAPPSVSGPPPGQDPHIASPIPMDDPDPEDAFGSPAPRPEDSVHEQQLRNQLPQS